MYHHDPARIFYSMRTSVGIMLTLSALTVAGCSSQTMAATPAVSATTTSQSPTSTPTYAAPTDASAVAAQVKASVPTVAKVVTITETNDPNGKIGRPNGYTSAAVIYDSGVTCTKLSVDCGATVEVWATQAQAQARMDFIQGVLKASPVLGSEYDTVKGGVLLRVAGAVKPSAAKTYAAAI